VEEAMRLMEESKASIVIEKKQAVDPVSAVFSIIRDYSRGAGTDSVIYDDVLPRVLAKGYSQQQLMACIKEYEQLGVWLWDNTKIIFVS
jgi:DNA replication licensing factor MCM7